MNSYVTVAKNVMIVGDISDPKKVKDISNIGHKSRLFSFMNFFETDF